MRRFHLPSQINCSESISGNLRLRLETVIATSIRHVAGATGSAAQIVNSAPQHGLREPFSALRADQQQGSYAIPSYDNNGAPIQLPLQDKKHAAPPKLRWRHPRGSVADDKVIDGVSPFESQLIAIFPGWKAVRVHADRYAMTTSLPRAIQWGNMLFGARSYIILEGPTGKDHLHYYVVGTTHALRVPDLTAGSGTSIAGGEVWGLKQRIHWQTQLHDDTHGFYMLRALFTAEGQPMWPLSRELAEEFYAELRLSNPHQRQIPRELARPLVFGEIDRLIAADKGQEAATKLAELDASAFVLVDWETRVKYLEILTDAWTFEAEERAILEIFKSINGRAELDAALALLKKKGKYDKLFRDINSQLTTLLVEIGKRFGDPAPLSYRALVELLQEAGLVPRDWKDSAKYITITPGGPQIDNNLFAEAEEAARSFVEFLGGALEGIVMLVAHPDKLIEGIGQLVKLSVMVQLAEMGYQPAVQFVSAILKNLAQQVVYGFKGAVVLGISGSLLRRIKWAIVWEIASWFIGIGEVKAAISGIGVTEKLSALGRLLRILRVLGKAAETEQTASKMEHLARLVQKLSIISHEDDVLRLFSHLPERDLLRIAEGLETADIHGLQSMAELTAKYPELASAAQHALGRAEALYRLEARAGRLSDNLIEGFQKLAQRSGFNNAELFNLMDSLPAEHAELYMRLIRSMPESAFGSGVGARSYTFFSNLAQRPQSMRFLANTGYETFSALYRHSNYDFVRFEEHLHALEDIAQKIPVDQRAVEYQRLIDKLTHGDTAAMEELRSAVNARRAAAGKPLLRSFSAAELDEIVDKTADIKKIRELARDMDPSTRGSLFERWSNRYVFKNKNKVRVRKADNAHLEDFEGGLLADLHREMDHYDAATGEIWDTKIYDKYTVPDREQLHDYRIMEEAGQIKAADGRMLPINDVNYLFSDIEAARAHASLIRVEGGGSVWYIDDHGLLQLLP